MKKTIYLNNIRWVVVVLVMIYHVFYVFNAEGVLGGVGPLSKVQYQDAILYFLYPWFMVVLFIVSGICAWYDLREHPDLKTFIKNRTVKLLVPSTLGLFAYQWILGLFNLYINHAINQIPAIILYPVAALSGTGPLWFIQLLWIYDMLLALLVKLGWSEKVWDKTGEIRFWQVILLGFGLWGSSYLLNTPIVTVYRIGIYFYAFLCGYWVFSHQNIQKKLKKYASWLTVAAFLMGIGYVTHYFGKNYTDTAVLTSFYTNAYAWTASLAVLGGFNRWFNWGNRFTEWMTKNSFGFYVCQYLAIAVPCYYLKRLGIAVFWIYVLALLAEFILTFILYEGIKRIPGLRFLVLGIRK